MKKLKRNKKLVIGLTGSFATGKSTVAKMFKSSGVEVIDADMVGRGLIKPGSSVYRKTIRLFGRGIADRSGNIRRPELARIVFSDKKALDRFNRIIHPAIIREIKRRVKSSVEKVVILDAPLLLEKKLDMITDGVIVVKASLDKQIRRAQKRSAISKSEIIARIQSQIPLKKKLGLADFIIDNNGTIGNTRKQVALIRRLLWRS
jgi:dephospho-CoA kinase